MIGPGDLRRLAIALREVANRVAQVIEAIANKVEDNPGPWYSLWTGGEKEDENTDKS